MQNNPDVSKEQVFIHLCMRAVEASGAANLKFVVANETIQLVHYRQAAVFDLDLGGKPFLRMASGLASVAQDSPYVVWLDKLARSLFDLNKHFQTLDFSKAPAEFVEDWQEWLPGHLLVLPLRDRDETCLGCVLYARENAWSEVEIEQLIFLHKVYAYCLGALGNRKKGFFENLSRWVGRKYVRAALIALIVLMLLPVRMSALAPAEVIALNAFSVATPQDGVIHSFDIQPNAQVRKGDLLFTLDATSTANRVEVAAKELEIAKADASVAELRAFDDARAKAELVTAIGRVREKEAELQSARDLMARIEVRAERDGIAIFSDANDWIGRPVQTGERVMQIADPKDAGLLMWLPVKDALNLEKQAPMKLFLHTSPLSPIDAELVQTSYQPTLSPDNVASYRVKGAFLAGENVPRIGMRGTARISGDWGVLGYYLFRRPIASLREWTGM